MLLMTAVIHDCDGINDRTIHEFNCVPVPYLCVHDVLEDSDVKGSSMTSLLCMKAVI